MRSHSSRRRFLAAGAALLAAPVARRAGALEDGGPPFVVTPPVVVERMLYLAAPKPGEYLVDLGCGDGRIVIEAARRGATALGVDIDPRLVEHARAAAERAGVSARARFEVRDLFDTDLNAANVVTLYLLPEVNLKLRPRLIASLKPGARVVSHDFDLGDWSADETIDVRVPEKPVGPLGRSKVMLWVVPADLRGRWVGELPGHGGRWRFEVGQSYQMLQVRAFGGASEVPIRSAVLSGNEVLMLGVGMVAGKAWNHRFEGRLEGDTIVGELRLSDGEQVRRLPWRITKNP